MSSTNAFTRRGFLTASAAVGGAIAASPLLAACGNSAGKGGTSTKAGIQAVLPTFKPLAGGVTPDIAVVNGVNGASTNPGFLKYPTNLPKTVTGKVGSGGSYTAVAPSWNPCRRRATPTTTPSTRPSARPSSRSRPTATPTTR